MMAGLSGPSSRSSGSSTPRFAIRCLPSSSTELLPRIQAEEYLRVPRAYQQKLSFRETVLDLAQDPERAHQVWVQCARDILSYVNVFRYT